MVLIRVQKRDKSKAFKILLDNGRFSRIDGMFRIDENKEKGLQQLRHDNIDFEEVC